MKKITYLLLLISGSSYSQCLTTTPIVDTIIYAESNQCGAVFNYTSPTFQNSCPAIIRDTFYFTGTPQQFTIPAGTSNVTIETWGAQGGANWSNNTNYGGYNKADFPVSPGNVLNIFVGGKATSTIGGYNGGGNGDGAGIGGGGATDVRLNGSSLTDRIIVSGGGGGAGYWSGLHVVGGIGGGTNGGDGYRNTTADIGGLGATTTGPGANGTCVNFNVTSMAGSLGQGGTPSGYGCGCEGYGGGGGYYGGAGSGNCRGGGGGSGYISPLGTNTTATDGIQIGNGKVVISYLGTGNTSIVQTSGLSSGQLFPVGTTTISFQASIINETLTNSYNVTVVDSISPTLVNANNMVVSADNGLCSATLVPSPIAVTDNCGMATLSNNAPAIFPIGNTTVTWTATDIHGNIAQFDQLITVEDNEAPIFTGILTNLQTCEGPVTFGVPSFTDNCTATVTQLSGPLSGDVLSTGNYQVVYIVTDAGNNSDTTTMNINVTPTPLVTLNILTPSEIVCVNHGSFSLNGEDPSGGIWSGNGVSSNFFDPAFAGVGSQIISYTYTDFLGCTASATDTVVVSACAEIEEQSNNVFAAFPNPANTLITIQLQESGVLSLIDGLGKRVMSQRCDASESGISIAEIANGLYTLQFENERGQTQQLKLIIQH